MAAGAKAAPAEVDWTATRARLRRLGVASFQLEGLGAGRCRFRCWVPVAGAAPRCVEAEGATEAEAVARCLEQAERGR